MKKLIMLIIGMLISVSSFSQTTLKTITEQPRVIKDSTGITLLAFDETQILTIIKALKEGDVNKKVIKEIEKQLKLLKQQNMFLKSENDSLKAQVQTYIEIKLGLENQVSLKVKENDNLNKNIIDASTIENNLNKEIEIYKQKIKRKNGWIIKLTASNIITVGLLALLIF